MHKLRLGVIAAAVLMPLALASPAHAIHDTERVTAGPMVFGPNGFGGVSCPEGKTVVTGGYTTPEDQEPLHVKLSEAMAPETVYPHWTTGPGETGWYVQNGETGQSLTVWADCATEPEPEPSESPTAEPSQSPTAEPVDCVDVNTADAETLTRLKHVDADRAAQILALRPFTSVDDLGRVDGLLAGGPRLAELVAGGDGFLPLCPITAPPAEPSSAAPSTTAPAAGGLPITGAPLAGLTIGGVVLLGAGTGLMLARRRRRFVA